MAALSDKRPALVFIGFMGAGKSKAVGAAADAGLEAVDADHELELALGMPIADFFAAHDEDEFRARERELVVGLLDRVDGGAIALGGGSVLSEQVREALDRDGQEHVRIVVSGGFTAERIRAFEERGVPVDSYGVGSALIRGENDFTADIVMTDGRPSAKIGRRYRENTRLELFD